MTFFHRILLQWALFGWTKKCPDIKRPVLDGFSVTVFNFLLWLESLEVQTLSNKLDFLRKTEREEIEGRQQNRVK